MAQWQDLHGDADLDPPGARRDGAGDAERRRQQRAARLEMQFGEPHHIEAQPLGRVDLVHRLVEGLALGPAGKRRKLVKHAEFHDGLALLLRFPGTLAKPAGPSQARSLAPMPTAPIMRSSPRISVTAKSGERR